MAKIDLHVHSTASDGKYTPIELVDIAIKKKVPVIAIADHDTVKGVNEAIKYSKNKNIKVVPGIEITITPPKNCKELHMVGLFINPEDTEIKKINERHRKYTEKVAKKIIKKLNNLGYKINFKELLEETNGKHLGRPWISKILIRKYPKEFKDRKEVFNKLLGKQGKAFVRPKGTSMKKAIDMIHNAGGIAIVAHPCFLGDKMEEVVEEFIKFSGDGIEKDFLKKSYIQKDMKKRINKVIKKYNLIISGGTDFHEEKENGMEMGDIGLNEKEFENLQKYYKKFGEKKS